MNQLACPETGFSRRGFMIGIAGLTFAVAIGRERFGRAATEASDVFGTPFNPWVSIAPSVGTADTSVIFKTSQCKAPP